MTPVDQILQLAAQGRMDALDFMQRAGGHFHAVDDVIDQGFEPQRYLETFAQAIDVYSHPFYHAHVLALRGVCETLLQQYADSVRMEAAPELWKQRTSDVLRHAGNELIIAVARITGGWALATKVSDALRELSWREHHDAEGKRI